MLDLRLGEPHVGIDLDELQFDEISTSLDCYQIGSRLDALTDELSAALRCTASRLTITPGATAALACLVHSSKPSRVWLPSPCYPGYFSLLDAASELVSYPYGRLPALSELAAGDLVVLNSPHNPTGRRLTVEEVAEVAQAAECSRAEVLLDAVYEPFDSSVWGVNCASLTIIGSFSKVLGVPGLRCGFVVSPNPETADEVSGWVRAHLLGPSGPSVSIARRLLASWCEIYGRLQQVAQSQADQITTEASICGLAFHAGLPVPFGLLISENHDMDLENAARAAGILTTPLRAMIPSRSAPRNVVRIPLAISAPQLERLLKGLSEIGRS